MKRYFTLPLFLLLSIIVKSQTYVSGFISANTNWTVAGAPYIVTGNALVSIGYTLTIDPGVIIKFNTNTALQVDGQLIAIGTAANHITFTSNQSVPKAGDWGKLHIGDNSIDAVYDVNGHYVSGTILKYCDVLYAGGVSFGAIHIESASPYISNCNIEHSKASGIYCAGSSYILDSSLVNDCVNYGMYFDQITLNSCGLTIRTDTIKNNKAGGLYLTGDPGCKTIIDNNYFVANGSSGSVAGGINFSFTITNVQITENYFISNTSYGAINAYNILNAKIERNYFLYNVTSGNPGIGTVTFSNFNKIKVAENYFIKDTITIHNSAILTFTNSIYNNDTDSVVCNTFQENVTGAYDYGALHIYTTGRAIVKSNIFDGNVNNAANAFSVSHLISLSDDPISFSNNTIKNNSAPNGSGCYFAPFLKDNTEALHIEYNEFSNNTAKNIIYLDGALINNSNYDFLYLKHNNFLDATNHIELYNHIPFGSPNVYADSNYWGSISTQHIDSIIYDYFDTANYSVVYYSPIMIEAVAIDTACSLGIPTTVAVVKDTETSSNAYPNPFSSYTEILFNRELKESSLFLYNVFGQKVMERNSINGRRFSISRQGLPSGIYIYRLIEKEKLMGSGKIVVE